MVLKRIFALIVPLLIGGLLGSILGGIVTGSEDYVIVWGVGGPIVLTAAILIGIAINAVKVTQKKKQSATRATPAGINETVTGVTKADVEAVMNPSSSAAPATGVVLNGEPMRDGGVAMAVRPDGRPPGPVRLRRWLAVVLLLAGAAIALIPAYTMLGWVASDFAHGRPFDGRDMRDGRHQNEAVAQIAGVVGSADMTYISFYEDYIIVTARTSPRSDTVDTYMWRGGQAFNAGPGGFEGDLANELFDSSRIDFSIIPSLITIAKRDSGMNDTDDFYPTVRRDSGSEGLGDPVITISLSDEYYSAYYTFSLDGEILDRSGSAFE